MHCIQQLLSKLYMTFCVAAENQHGSVTLKNPVIFTFTFFQPSANLYMCKKKTRFHLWFENHLVICEKEKSHAVPNDARGEKKKKSLFLSNWEWTNWACNCLSVLDGRNAFQPIVLLLGEATVFLYLTALNKRSHMDINLKTSPPQNVFWKTHLFILKSYVCAAHNDDLHLNVILLGCTHHSQYLHQIKKRQI